MCVCVSVCVMGKVVLRDQVTDALSDVCMSVGRGYVLRGCVSVSCK